MGKARLLFPCAAWMIVAALIVPGRSTAGAPPPVLLTRQSGAWSNPATWEGGKIPRQGDRVLIRQGDAVVYDVESDEVIRSICISGNLSFARDRDTELNVGLIRIEAGNHYSEEGFDCEFFAPNNHGQGHEGGQSHAHRGDPRPVLEIGTPNDPIPAGHTARVRLHYVEGMDKESCPAIVCCGGRMDLHGARMNRTWVKLIDSAAVGDTRLFLATEADGWEAGDRVVVTGTARQRPFAGNATASVADRSASEVRRIESLIPVHSRQTRDSNTAIILELGEPLEHPHRGGEYSAEVANLSRNVIIESANPEGVRGHTMYHRDSAGSISYVEFRHLGKKGVLGRYPIHFHLVGDTMRGSYVIGASVWESHNRWITIHGTQYIVVRDCVGYQSLGHGYFLEDGTEVFNVWDRNLAVQALDGEPLPEQVLPFDQNNGAGFWWANSLNAFTRNVAVECDQHGFRFEAVKMEKFDPVLPIMQPDGSRKPIDIRTLPFLRFEGNEAHCQRRFGLNLGGIRGMTFNDFYRPNEGSNTRQRELALSIGGTVAGVGPDYRHPFHIRDFKVWDTHWSFHAGAPCVWVEGMDVFDCQYGIWRSTIDLHKYEDLSFHNIHSAAIFFPTGGHGPQIHMQDGHLTFPNIDPTDDLPPVTIITHVRPIEEDSLRICGTTVDNYEVTRVLVNGQEARPTRDNFAQWEIELTVPRDGEEFAITAHAEDAAGNVEPRPHQLVWNAPAIKASESPVAQNYIDATGPNNEIALP